MYLVAIFCLLVVAATCIAGTFCEKYDDNLAQRIGMAVMTFFCFGRAITIYKSQFVDPELMVAYIGMACFAAGTVCKIVLVCRKQRRWNGVERRSFHARHIR